MKRRRELVLIIVIIVAIFALNEGIKIVTGSNVPLAIVDGRSMIPTFHEGDVVLVVGVKPSDIRVGDIIVYKVSDKLIIHRVIEISINDGKYFFRTKGDNNPVPDLNLVSEDQVVGRVFGVILPRIGVLISKFLLPYKYIVVALLIALIIIIILWPQRKDVKIEAKGHV
ncbi:MAG: signal peptidase I [Candidatus Nezhaarchaeota archaeon]|nr:signal peptidase I [Candidatus Nezhaarchaeota archaeon]MCX8141836.1 signal peptidase I [Candidatus Nezhaarchaeota archaeon]MDW8050383.1 signal peptidase I [Nitrososphaerota archaeon]